MNDNPETKFCGDNPVSAVRWMPKMLPSRYPWLALTMIALGWLGMLAAAKAATYSSAQPMVQSRHFHTATHLTNGEVLVAGAQLSKIAERYNPRTGAWSRTGDMLLIRYHHTATLLPNGKVLVAGGVGAPDASSPTQYYRSSELYDPATGTWTATGSLNTARTDHTATLLNSGKVLVTGGGTASGNYLASAELFDPATSRWTTVPSAMTRSRSDHTATLLADGKVLVTGQVGYPNPPAAEIFDPSTNTFTLSGVPNVGRYLHSATRLPDGKVLVAGGSTSSGTAATAEIYDPSTGVWTATGSMGATRYGHSTVLLPDGKVLVTGGYNSNTVSGTEIFDPATGTWSAAGSLGQARHAHTATMLDNGRVLIAGGWGRPALTSVEICDWSTGSWTGATGSLSNARYFHTETLLPNGKVLVAGGLNSGSNPAAAELYDPSTNTWGAAGSVITGRHKHTATLLPNGKVLIAGGYNNSTSNDISSAELYDPATNLWTASGNLAYQRSSHTATLLPNGKVLVAGGGGFGSLEEVYDPANGTWTTVGAMSTLRKDATATLLPNGKVLLAAGSRGQNQASADLFDPVTNTWSATGSLATARSLHGAALLPNGIVLVCGGQGGGISTELYDPAAGTWSPGPAMTASRYAHSTTTLPDGRVLVAGGYGTTSVTSSAEIYDFLTGRWTTAPAMAKARWFHTAVRLPSGTILVAAGNLGAANTMDCERFNPGLNYLPAWQPTITTNFSTPVEMGTTLSISGTRFRGIAEGSDGSPQNSPADHPVVILSSLTNGQSIALSSTSWSTTSLVTGKLSGLHPGWAYATVVVNGIRSDAKLVRIIASSNANLSGLVLSSGTLSPLFSSAATTYAATVPYSVFGLTVTPSVQETGATVKIRINSGAFIDCIPGSESQAFNLNNGANTLEVRVTAPNGTTTKSYTVTITRNYPQLVVKNGATTLVDGSTTPVDFGQVAPGGSRSVTFTLSNPGTDNLVLGEIFKDGAHAGEFGVGSPAVTTIPPSGSATVTVSFNPSAAGVKAAAIHLPSNLAGSANPFDINFRGTANTAPTFAGYTVGTPFQTPAVIPFRKLLAKATDPDGDPLTVSAAAAVSALGGGIVMRSDSLLYTPATGATGADNFSVTIADGRGGTIIGTVTVTIGPPPSGGGSSANPPKLTVLPDGKVGIAFQGIPGRAYIVQRSIAGLDNWATLTTLTADAAGRVSFTDDNPPPGSAFYRLALP